jgi:hypothetical protein
LSLKYAINPFNLKLKRQVWKTLNLPFSGRSLFSSKNKTIEITCHASIAYCCEYRIFKVDVPVKKGNSN